MEWKAEYATGIHNIDDQHRTILELVTQFEKLSEEAENWIGRHQLILRTREFMEFHFSVEESLMRLVPNSDSAVHRAEHRYVLANLADLERQSRLEMKKDELVPLMRHLLFDHIVGSDKFFVRHARDKWRDFAMR